MGFLHSATSSQRYIWVITYTSSTNSHVASHILEVMSTRCVLLAKPLRCDPSADSWSWSRCDHPAWCAAIPPVLMGLCWGEGRPDSPSPSQSTLRWLLHQTEQAHSYSSFQNFQLWDVLDGLKTKDLSAHASWSTASELPAHRTPQSSPAWSSAAWHLTLPNSSGQSREIFPF